MGAEPHTLIQCSVSVVCQVTCLLHNKAPTAGLNVPDKSMHALMHMSYLYTAAKIGFGQKYNSAQLFIEKHFLAELAQSSVRQE